MIAFIVVAGLSLLSVGAPATPAFARLGGATTIGNLQLLCADCNREKGADV